ncbi:MAG TPA: SdrD B-like domain-containing protein, partial [Longimicrobium sp.]|nr:SdrD B-like domain-containing protein [Longimicrobium sp.]
AALFAAACDESTGPAGAPTDLTVRVYVDADGSGHFNSGDVPVAGATVTATGEDGSTATAQTDAQGAASFGGLAPGTWALSLSGAAPAGAVLTTATQPLVTATALGGQATAEFRYAYFPGSVSGRLFRDDNDNQEFDAGVDLPAPGIAVQIFAGGTATGTPAATATTDASGVFSFPGLRPGTYTVRVVAPEGVTIVDGADKVVTVPAQEPPVQLAIRFTGNLRIPIAQARTRAPGSSVTVEGTVTAGRAQLGGRNFYVQDATGGIQVFLPSSSPAQPAPGDSVRVSGGIGVFRGAVQISVSPVVETLGTRPVPAPRALDGPEVMERGFEGQLARVDSLTVVSTATTGSTSANVNVRTPQGDEFQVRLENTTHVPLSTFVVGNTYTVTGVLDVFTTSSTPPDSVPQLKPRDVSDVRDNSPPTIAQIKGEALGTEVTATGVVTAAPGTFSSQYFYIQDRTGGLLVYRFHRGVTLQAGDSVRVSGALRNPFGEFQVDTVTRADSVDVTVIGPGTVPAPRVITGAELDARTYESELARIDDVVVLTVGSQSSTGSGFNVTARAPDGTVITIRADGPTNVEAPAFTVGATYDIVGILTVFGGNAQIKPRSTADVIAS